MPRHTNAVLVATTLLGLACSAPDPERAVGILPPASASKAGPSNPQLRFQLVSSFLPNGGTEAVAAAITADNTSDYVNNVCGVLAVINLATTDGLFDPDANYSSRLGNCGPRYVRMAVAFAGSTVTVNDGAYITIGGLGAVTATGTGRLGFQLSAAAISATGCDFVRYGYPGDPVGTAPARITVTAIAQNKRTWEVESTGGHRPVCWTRAGKNYQKTLLEPMPFKITITEL